MKHRIGYNKLERTASHRKALLRNLAIQLFRHERIRTTKSKALEARKFAEKLITRAREDSVHNRRTVAKLIHDKEILAKLFTDIAPRYMERPGGYTRVLKLGRRNGDAAEMVLLELVEESDSDVKSGRRRRRAVEPVKAKPAAEEGPSAKGLEEDTVEDSVEDTVEDSVEDSVDDSVEDSVEDDRGDSEGGAAEKGAVVGDPVPEESSGNGTEESPPAEKPEK